MLTFITFLLKYSKSNNYYSLLLTPWHFFRLQGTAFSYTWNYILETTKEYMISLHPFHDLKRNLLALRPTDHPRTSMGTIPDRSYFDPSCFRIIFFSWKGCKRKQMEIEKRLLGLRHIFWFGAYISGLK